MLDSLGGVFDFVKWINGLVVYWGSVVVVVVVVVVIVKFIFNLMVGCRKFLLGLVLWLIFGNIVFLVGFFY